MKIVEALDAPQVTLAGLRASGRAVITRVEAASVLEVDPRTVTKMIQDGEIFAISAGTAVRIPLNRFLELLDANEEAA